MLYRIGQDTYRAGGYGRGGGKDKESLTTSGLTDEATDRETLGALGMGEAVEKIESH